MNRTIIQLVGPPGSGKTEAVKYASKKYRFTPIPVSDLIRDWASYRDIELFEREDYEAAHTQMLGELGRHAITDMILNSPSDWTLVDGMSVPAHAKLLHTYGPIIALDCPLEIRHPRLMRRRGPLDNVSLEELRAYEEAESRNTDPFTQNTRAVMESADFHIDSSQQLPWVHHALDKYLSPHVVV